MWTTTALTSRAEILEFLETDRLYAAYAIGDLEPGLFEQSEWFGVAPSAPAVGTGEAGSAAGGRLRAVVLRFSGLTPPALFLMGDPAGLRAILAGPSSKWETGEVCLTCRREHLAVAEASYAMGVPTAMWRMVLRRELFKPVGGRCIRLGPEDIGRLAELYSQGGGEAFHARQLEQGIFYGVEAGGRLVSVAGTHLVGHTYRVAAVGNVFTHPSWRGRGYGAATTSAVTAELVSLGIRDIILNVSQVNASAVRTYERLGFECYCPFVEAVARPSPGHGDLV
jgi:GNAT superfamily N-acetyltransferase